MNVEEILTIIAVLGAVLFFNIMAIGTMADEIAKIIREIRRKY